LIVTFRILCTFLTDMHISVFYLSMLICSTFFRPRNRLRRTTVARAVKRTVTSAVLKLGDGLLKARLLHLLLSYL